MPRSGYNPNIAPDPAGWLALDESTAQWLVRRYHASSRCEHPPAENPILHATVHVIVENQIALGDQTPAAATLAGLMRDGLDRHQAVHAIGSVLAEHIYNLLKSGDNADHANPDVYYDAIRALTSEQWLRSGQDTSDDPPPWLAAPEALSDWSAASLDTIMAGLCIPTPHYPRVALRAAQQRRAEITDRLISLIQDVHRAALNGEMPDHNGHIFAMFLLAEFEEVRAFDAIADFFTLLGDRCESLTGDFVTEDLARILASVCGGRIDALARIIEDGTRWEYVRGAALKALCALVQRDLITRKAATTYLTSLVRERLDPERSPVLDEVANVVLEVYAEELFADVRQWMKDGRIEPFVLQPSDVNRTERGGLGAAMADLARNPHLQPVRDVVAETEWWYCYAEPDEPELAGEEPPLYLDSELDDDAEDAYGTARPAAEPVRVVKIGRNEPCPCGSGKKYKKCCLETP